MSELDAAREALADTDLHEGVHRARKSVRRVRASLALAGGILGPGAAMLDRELRGLNEGLSTLRDAHALVETLDRLRARRVSAETKALLDRAREAAVAARDACTTDALRSDPGLIVRRALLDVLRAALPALAWERATSAGLRMAVADADERTRRARERAQHSGKDTDWHRWRRRARRASQQRRAMDAVGLRVVAAPKAFDKRTTERLGEAQDLSLLRDHCGRESPFSLDDRKALRRYSADALERLRSRIAVAPG
ncbi:CHAD domain-containing protein [Lysobacter sp. LF1]|uniref:CHAD domain-containing protein n=1 Tax=Lysobacter stagni TaxID=3045172 RepID=A0ABT6XDJ0_9GAMM|nr:CHAD domain-containing protein [Lysobacter sp. LF1]MDI9238209.1 CHAD domain-containing protein [Lysobacter sp. LF1]